MKRFLTKNYNLLYFKIGDLMPNLSKEIIIKFMKKLSIIIIFGLQYFMAFSQDFIKFDEKEGLPSKGQHFSSVVEDSLGNVWISGIDGIFKWDGNKFTYIKLNGIWHASGQVNSVWLDEHKNVLLHDFGYKKIYKIDNDQLIDLKINLTKLIYNRSGYFIGVHEKNKLFQLNDGVLEFVDKVGMVFPKATLLDRNNNLWISTEKGIFKFSDGKWVRFNNEQGLKCKVVYDLYQDTKGYYWLTTDNGIYCYESTIWVNFSEMFKLKNSKKITQICEDSNGKLWFSSINNGAFCYDYKNFSHFTTDNNLYSDKISNIAADKGGNIWVSHIGV